MQIQSFTTKCPSEFYSFLSHFSGFFTHFLKGRFGGIESLEGIPPENLMSEKFDRGCCRKKTKRQVFFIRWGSIKQIPEAHQWYWWVVHRQKSVFFWNAKVFFWNPHNICNEKVHFIKHAYFHFSVTNLKQTIFVYKNNYLSSYRISRFCS